MSEPLTLESIKAQQTKLGEMIARFEAQAKTAAAFPITLDFPELKVGERYVGAIVSADDSRRYHLILLPGVAENIPWQDAMAWASQQGGELPDRVEGALLFATMKDEFQPEWHWTREQHASYSDNAWGQGFNYGTQSNIHKSYEVRARAVRRLAIL